MAEYRYSHIFMQPELQGNPKFLTIVVWSLNGSAKGQKECAFLIFDLLLSFMEDTVAYMYVLSGIDYKSYSVVIYLKTKS